MFARMGASASRDSAKHAGVGIIEALWHNTSWAALTLLMYSVKMSLA